MHEIHARSGRLLIRGIAGPIGPVRGIKIARKSRIALDLAAVGRVLAGVVVAG